MRPLLLLTAFTAGLGSLAVEMAGARLLAPWYGSTTLTWTALVGVVLAGMTAGHALGGHLAQDARDPRRVFQALLVAGLLAAAVPLVAEPVLRLVALDLGLDEAAGTSLASLLLLVPPILLVSTASPGLIQALSAAGEGTGRAAGRVSAAGTLGGILGTCLPGLVLLPALGTTRTFHVLGGLLALVGGLGWGLVRWRAAGTAPEGGAPPRPPSDP